jgi:hypothetical protein
MDMAPYEAAWAQGSTTSRKDGSTEEIDQLRQENASLREELTMLKKRAT